MRSGRFVLSSALLVFVSVPCFATTHHRHHFKHTKEVKGQRSIDDARATQIQSALIKSGYLSGEPSGHWDTATEAAMQKYQGDNGWQTKLTPDSRAIIKLGLGPSRDSEVSATSSAPPASQVGSDFLQK
jgi:peptidoglycan hydrolase-like protein with peptidoglycan-binding domain